LAGAFRAGRGRIGERNGETGARSSANAAVSRQGSPWSAVRGCGGPDGAGAALAAL